MLTGFIGKYMYGEDQQLSGNVEDKLRRYFNKEGYIYQRYYLIHEFLQNTLCTNYGRVAGDRYNEWRSVVALLCDSLCDNFSTQPPKKIEIDKLLSTFVTYIDKFKDTDFSEQIDIINMAISTRSAVKSEEQLYSFLNAGKIISKKNVSLDEAIYAIKSMLFATDYFNINSILKLSTFIINSSYINTLIDFSKISKKPGNKFLGLFFSDFILLPDILTLINYLLSQPNSKLVDYNVTKNDALNIQNFSLVCAFIYLRYILSSIMFVMRCDNTGYFDNLYIERDLLKPYHRLSFMIFTSVYRYFTPADFLLYISSQTLNDVCIYAQSLYTRDRLDEARAIASAISRDAGHKRFDEEIAKAIKEIEKKFPHGDQRGHVFMMKFLRDLDEFAPYFKERGFERNLRERLVEFCREKGKTDPGWRCVKGDPH